MFTEVLVPWDGKHCSTALEVGVSLANHGGTTVEVLVRPHTFDDPQEEEALRFAVANLEEAFAVSIGIKDLERKRFFTDATISELRNRPGAIMCMPSHGRGRWAVLTGSLTAEVLAYSPGAVVLCGPECDSMAFDRGGPILAALDGTAESELTIPIADEWAVAFGRTVELVTVLPEKPPSKLADAVAAGDVVESGYLMRLYRSDPDLRQHGASFDVLHGDPATSIVREAEDRGASLVVMASRVPLGLDRLVHGSTTDEVVRSSRSPVLALKGRVGDTA